MSTTLTLKPKMVIPCTLMLYSNVYRMMTKAVEQAKQWLETIGEGDAVKVTSRRMSILSFTRSSTTS